MLSNRSELGIADLLHQNCRVEKRLLSTHNTINREGQIDGSVALGTLTLRRRDDSFATQALQWMPYGHRGRGRLKNHAWKRDLEKEMWTAGYKYRWRKMEAAAQYRA